MDAALHIHSFRARHRAPHADGLRRCRAAQQALLDGELEAALSRLAGAEEIVVVRRLQVSLSLDAGHSDHVNARQWSDTLAIALSRALQHAPAHELLRFAGRRQALLAFVHDMIAGESGQAGHATRDWAWQGLGWLPATPGREASSRQRRDALLRLLADDAECGVPLLRGLLHTPSWPALLQLLSDGEGQGLAQSVLVRIADDAGATFDHGPRPDTATTAAADVAGAEPSPSLLELLRATSRAAASAERRTWALRLALMLAEPSLARRGAAAIDAALQTALQDAPVAPVDAAAAGPAAATTARAGHAADAARPGAAAANRAASLRHGAERDAAAQASATAAVVGQTEFGGLLLLLPLLAPCGALPWLEDPALWPATPFALHRLACRLQALAVDDPAALAFCGLPPNAAPPAPHAALTAAQQAALAAAQALLLAALDERLPAWRGPALWARVLRRRARIVAEPGWLEVHFSLRDVSLDLRRAALDLDPGFIPWLGVVLRYRYE